MSALGQCQPLKAYNNLGLKQRCKLIKSKHILPQTNGWIKISFKKSQLLPHLMKKTGKYFLIPECRDRTIISGFPLIQVRESHCILCYRNPEPWFIYLHPGVGNWGQTSLVCTPVAAGKSQFFVPCRCTHSISNSSFQVLGDWQGIRCFNRGIQIISLRCQYFILVAWHH